VSFCYGVVLCGVSSTLGFDCLLAGYVGKQRGVCPSTETTPKSSYIRTAVGLLQQFHIEVSSSYYCQFFALLSGHPHINGILRNFRHYCKDLLSRSDLDSPIYSSDLHPSFIRLLPPERPQQQGGIMSMNLFRLCGDMSHVFSIIVLLLRLRVAKNAQGEDAINAIIQRLLHWQN
jgi:hypothetical protein